MHCSRLYRIWVRTFQDILSNELISQHRLSIVRITEVKGSLAQDLSFPCCESSRRFWNLQHWVEHLMCPP